MEGGSQEMKLETPLIQSERRSLPRVRGFCTMRRVMRCVFTPLKRAAQVLLGLSLFVGSASSNPTDPDPRWIPPLSWNAIVVTLPLGLPEFLRAAPGRELFVRFETQPRFELRDGSFARAKFRPSVGMQVTPSTEVSIGAMALIEAGGDFTEYRSWQQVSHEKNIGGVVVVSRTRLEQRFPGITAGGDPRLGHRIRQMIQAQFPLNVDRSWLVILSDEVHFHATESSFGMAGFEQNRIGLRVRREFSPHLMVEAGPTYHTSRNPSLTTTVPLQQLNFVVTVNIDLPSLRKKK